MSTITLIHGTSANRANDIMKHGFDCRKVVWDCADPDYTYFYQLDKFIKAEGLDEDYTKAEQLIRCIYRANESAQITSALEKNPQDHTTVFEINISGIDEELEDFFDFIYPDRSCENMESAGAVCVENEIINKWLKLKRVTVRVHEFEFIPKLALGYLSGVAYNDYLQESLEALSMAEREMLEALVNRGFFCEELLDPEEITEYEVKF